MPFKKTTGLLLELNDVEQEVMAQIFDLAEQNIADAGLLHWKSGDPMDRKTSHSMILSMIEQLRKELGLPEEK